MEICKKLAYIDTKYRARHQSSVSFPIELTYFICSSVFDALNLELEFKKLNFQLYVPRANFDATGFVVAHLTLRKDFIDVPNIEDFWADYCDEFEVRRKTHQRFTLQQVMAFELKMNIANVKDDESELMDPQCVDVGTRESFQKWTGKKMRKTRFKQGHSKLLEELKDG